MAEKMAEKKVPYQYDGRQFEGMIVYDESVNGKASGRFHAARLEGRVRRHHRPGAQRRRQGLCRADGRHVRRPATAQKPKTQDDLRAGMLAVHKDQPFTLACGGKAYDTLLAEAQKLGIADTGKDRGDRLLRRRRLCPRTGARRRRTSRPSWCSTSPIPIRSNPARRATSRAACWRSTARADPVTPKPMMDALEDELTKAKVDWQVMMFGDAVHSFCDPTAQGPADALRRKALPQILHADARLFRRDVLNARGAAHSLAGRRMTEATGMSNSTSNLTSTLTRRTLLPVPPPRRSRRGADPAAAEAPRRRRRDARHLSLQDRHATS